MNSNNKHKPLITVYMPTHNRLELLQRAVVSVFAQTMQNFELIIVDDASSDDTFDYLQKLAEQDSRVTVLRNEVSQGACVARNRAIELAKGKFVTGLDDDDEFLPLCLRDMMTVMPLLIMVIFGIMVDKQKKLAI